jgi:hypothetical protein
VHPRCSLRLPLKSRSVDGAKITYLIDVFLHYNKFLTCFSCVGTIWGQASCCHSNEESLSSMLDWTYVLHGNNYWRQWCYTAGRSFGGR